MRRREFMGLVGGAATWPLTVGAQQSAGRVRRIGIFLFAKSDRTNVDPLVKELAALGYVDGKNVAIEYRDAGGQSEFIVKLAPEKEWEARQALVRKRMMAGSARPT